MTKLGCEVHPTAFRIYVYEQCQASSYLRSYFWFIAENPEKLQKLNALYRTNITCLLYQPLDIHFCQMKYFHLPIIQVRMKGGYRILSHPNSSGDSLFQENLVFPDREKMVMGAAILPILPTVPGIVSGEWVLELPCKFFRSNVNVYSVGVLPQLPSPNRRFTATPFLRKTQFLEWSSFVHYLCQANKLIQSVEQVFSRSGEFQISPKPENLSDCLSLYQIHIIFKRLRAFTCASW